MDTLNTLNVQTIIDLAAKIIVALIAIYVLPKIRELASAKLDAQQLADLEAIILSFVRAAEQTLKMEDPTGEKRKAYVVEQLKALNYEINSEIDAMIESAVFGLPHDHLFK